MGEEREVDRDGSRGLRAVLSSEVQWRVHGPEGLGTNVLNKALYGCDAGEGEGNGRDRVVGGTRQEIGESRR